MPVFITRWRDGDLSLTHVDTKEQAHAHFQKIACLDVEDILKLDAPDLTLTFTLDQKGNSILSSEDGAIAEARRICYPLLVEALGGMRPDHITDPTHVAKIDAIVDQELKLLPRPKRLARKVPRTRSSRSRT